MDDSLFIDPVRHQQRTQVNSEVKRNTENDATPLHVLNSNAAKGIYCRLSEKDIRFIVLQAGELADPIKCTLTVGHLDTLPSYEAVSYVWGSQCDPQEISLDGVSFCITQNLFKVLIRLRSKTGDRLLWIDALAINQSDIEERNTQVHKMLTIYHSAKTVLAYIGEGNEDLGEPANCWKVLNESPHDLNIPDWGSLLGGQDPLQLVWTFKSLDQYEFWSRAWIIQEITGSNVVFVLGSHMIAYNQLYQVFAQLVLQLAPLYNVSHGEDPEDCLHFIGPRISAIFMNRASIKHLSLESWFKIFVLMHDPRCSEPRDKIYAFYGLLAPEIRKQIPINYNMPVEELFTLITKVYIEQTGNLWLLSLVEVSPRSCSTTRSGTTTLPSWAFNFAGERSYFLRWHLPICDKGTKLKDDKTARHYYQFNLDGNPRLHVKGIRIGEVQEVDRSPRHKIFMGISFLLSKWNLRVRRSEESKLRSALLGSFAQPEDFSDLLPCHAQSLQSMRRELSPKVCAALNTHYERVLFSYMPRHGVCPSSESGAQREFGLGHPGALTGDNLCLILGCPIPLLLRAREDSYTVVGSAYVQGYMEGEAMDALGIDMENLQEFCLY